MPVVTFFNEHRSVDVESGTNLRKLMLRVGVTPYGGIARLTNCRGHNFCGTCAVDIADGKGASPKNQEEETTLGGNLAIVRVVDRNLRLACQTRVTGDMTVRTHPVRAIDRKATKGRMTTAGIVAFFLLCFLGIFVYLFFDMIKKF
jgi:ferredoxin